MILPLHQVGDLVDVQKHRYASRERLDGLQRFFVSGSNPVPLQLFFVKFHPLDEEAQGLIGNG